MADEHPVARRFVPRGPKLEEPLQVAQSILVGVDPEDPVHLVVSPVAGVSWGRLMISFETPNQCHVSLTLGKATALLLYRELRSRFLGDDRYGR